MEQTRTSRRRLISAVVFSVVVIPAIAFSTWVFPRLPTDEGSAFAQGWIAVSLAIAGVFAIWVLVAALLAVRPAWGDSLGRWVWVWTAACCAALGIAGVTHASNETVASTLLYACGMLSVISGVIGLVAAVIPPRARRDFYGNPM